MQETEGPSDGARRDDLVRRVESLENELRQLREVVTRLNERLAAPPVTPTPVPTTAPAPPQGAPSGPRPSVPPPPPRPTHLPLPPPQYARPAAPVPPKPGASEKRGFEIPAHMRRGEYWLNKVGIGLLLFGVAFGFKYSIDQGWLTPWVRVVIGLVIGGVLLGFGLRVRAQRRHFSQVLIGGAIAAWYITGFSAYQLLHILPYAPAFGFMVAVTLLAFVLSLHQDEAILALIGLLGGLGTPFLLYTSEGSLPGLIAYTSLVLLGAGAVYFYKGWRSLLWVSGIGGWLVLIIGLVSTLDIFNESLSTDKWALQTGYTFAWLWLWLMPIAREIVWLRNPERWARPAFDFAEKSLSRKTRSAFDRHLHVLSVTSFMAALVLSTATWSSVDREVWGGICLGTAALYGLVFLGLRGFDKLKNLGHTQLMMAVIVAALGLFLLFEGRLQFVVLAFDAAALLYIGQRINDRGVQIVGHIVFLVTARQLINNLMYEDVTSPVLINPNSLSWLGAIAAAAATGLLSRDQRRRDTYVLMAAFFLGILFVRDLSVTYEYLALAALSGMVMLVGRRIQSPAIDLGGMVLMLILMCISVAQSVLWRAWPSSMLAWAWPVDVVLVPLIVGRAVWHKAAVERDWVTIVGAVVVGGILNRFFDGNALLALLTAEVALLHLLAWRFKLNAPRIATGVFMAAMTVWILSRLTTLERETLPLLNLTAAAELLFIAVCVSVTRLLTNRNERTAHGVAALGLTLIWLWSEFSHTSNGQAFVTIGWGVLGIALLVVGLWWNAARLRLAGLTVLGLTVAKLFLVDLSNLQMIWRVLLFMGFGALFLVLSYFFRNLWRPDTKQAGKDTEP